MRRRRWFGKAYEDGFASGQRRTRAGLPLLGGATLKCAALHEYELPPCYVDRHMSRAPLGSCLLSYGVEYQA